MKYLGLSNNPCTEIYIYEKNICYIQKFLLDLTLCVIEA